MPYRLDDTIVAIASVPGGAARGIVRLSGPDARVCVERVFQPHGRFDLSSLARPTAIPGLLRLAERAKLACELYFWPTRRSYTGHPVVEIHTLGSGPLLEAVLRTVCAAGSRLAEPGEFTLRAFLAGRIDLTRAEAVLGVIDAADPHQLDVALAQLAGGLARPIDQLRDGLVDLLAHLEAGFDFADEDLPFLTPEQLNRRLASAAERVAKLTRQMAARSQTSEAASAVLRGWPNTGKSSLFNALLGRTGALVCDQGGTTRDYLTARVDLDGVPCRLIDTAGVEAEPEPDSPYPDLQEAVQSVSSQQSRRARVQILCIDSTRPLCAWERAELAPRNAALQLVVLTKIDAIRDTDYAQPALETSSLTGQGIDTLRARLRDAVLAASAFDAGVVAGTAARCGESLRLAAECLGRARRLARTDGGEELLAAEIRSALDELGGVVGAVHTDDVLDRVFSRFCIGK